MKSSIFFLLSFLLLSSCQTTSKSSKDVQSDLEAYIGKKIKYELTPISESEKKQEVVYFDCNINLYHDSPMDMSFVNIQKSFVIEVNFHLQTTSNFKGELSLPVSGIIWEGNSNLFIRAISKQETKTWDYSTLQDFLLAYSGTVTNSLNGQARIEMQNFPAETELEFSLTTRTTSTPFIIDLSFAKNAHFRRLSVKTNISGFAQGIQWKTNIPLTFSETKNAVSAFNNANQNGQPKIGKLTEGKETASLINQNIEEPGLAIYFMNNIDSRLATEKSMIGMQVHSLFDVKSEISRSDYEKLITDTFLRMRLNREKRQELNKKTEREVVDFISNEINSLAETDYLKTYFTDFDLKYNFETIKIVLKEFIYDSIGLKDIIFEYSWNPDFKNLRLLDCTTFRLNKSSDFIEENFDKQFKLEKKK